MRALASRKRSHLLVIVCAQGGALPDAASEFNRLLQTGTSSMSTKTSGAFGEGDAPAVSMGMVGNAHPSLIVPMERGDLGVNHAAAKERLLFVSARPVEPHSPLPPALELPEGAHKWMWPRLLKCVFGEQVLPCSRTAPMTPHARPSS